MEGKFWKVTIACSSWGENTKWSTHLDEEEDKAPSQANNFLKQAIDLVVEAFKSLEEEEGDTCRKMNEELLEEEAGSGK